MKYKFYFERGGTSPLIPITTIAEDIYDALVKVNKVLRNTDPERTYLKRDCQKVEVLDG